MRASSWLLCSLFALAAGCGETRDRGADAPGTDTTAAAAASGGSVAIVTVLYNEPRDTAAFERYYSTIHLPLVQANQDDIGFTRADLTKFASTGEGKEPPYYRQAELYFNSIDDLQKGIATAGFKKVADDLGNFATGGVTAMIARASNQHGEGSNGDPAAIFTVIYKAPKDTAAFEKYYADEHLPLVVAGQQQIGFERAELTKFDASLDGSKPARYRQAVLYFSSMDALERGTATPAFKEVAGDLPRFATGGFDALVGAETR